MPILVKDYVWRQNDKSVFLKIPLHGIHVSKVDVFASDSYIKVHFEQFFCEIFLAHKVVESRSKCTLKNVEAIFELEKEVQEVWVTLTAHINKEEKMRLKELIMRSALEKEQTIQIERTKLKQRLTSSAVQNQMSEDAAAREQIDRLRSLQRGHFIDSMNQRTGTESANESSKLKKRRKHKSEISSVNRTPWPPLKQEEDLPQPRQAGQIAVNFTKREFPTPSREATADMEGEWLKKQVEAQRSMGFASVDLRPEEMNPTWLKAKGDEFFLKLNYQAAVNAYTAGIQLNSTVPALYANRSCAQYTLQHFGRCIDDCTKALELLVPPCPSNLKTRTACIARRGASLCQIGYLAQGIEEMLCALSLDPDNQGLKNDIGKAKEKLHRTGRE